jgi:hypothetical protein
MGKQRYTPVDFHEENDSTARMPSKANTMFNNNVAGMLSVAAEDLLLPALVGAALPVVPGVEGAGWDGLVSGG